MCKKLRQHSSLITHVFSNNGRVYTLIRYVSERCHFQDIHVEDYSRTGLLRWVAEGLTCQLSKCLECSPSPLVWNLLHHMNCFIHIHVGVIMCWARKHNSQLQCGVSVYQSANYDGPKPQMSGLWESFLGLFSYILASLNFSSGGEFYEKLIWWL